MKRLIQTFKVDGEKIEMISITGLLNSEKDSRLISDLTESFLANNIKYKILRSNNDKDAEIWRDLEYTKKADERPVC